MCQFNLIIVNKESKNENLKKILIENGFGFRELDNESLANQLGVSKKIILTTKGHCDCMSILGISDQDPPIRIDVEKEKKKLRKKKWSESKIERYLNDKLKEQSKNEEADELYNVAEENNWIRIAELLNKQIGEFGILFHQFSGPMNKEQIKIEKRNKTSIGLLYQGALRNFRENQLNWIIK